LTERIRELRQRHYQDDATFFVELSNIMLSVARNDDERRQAEQLLKDMKAFRRLGLFGRGSRKA
jgi:hypothetical protein